MGLLKKVLIVLCGTPVLLFLIFLVLLESGWIDNYSLPPKPKIEEKFWNVNGTPDDTTIRKFEVKVQDATLKDLNARLRNFRPTPSLSKVDFTYGVPSPFIEKVRDYWLTKYNWRKWEKQLNAFPQYKTRIEGLDIHFLHVKPKPKAEQTVVPLMLLHGWPGSVLEFYKIIPKLITPSSTSRFAFEVVAPSLTGYGWSEGSKIEGLGTSRMATIFVKLMRRLKLADRGFYVQGGDWGAIIGDLMGKMYPTVVRGYHSNMLVPPVGNMRYTARLLLGMVSPKLVLSSNETWKVYPYFTKLGEIIRETGYLHIQATKPNTVGAALNDSPMGLASYIIEKFAVWTSPDSLSLPDGGLLKHFTLDELITNVMIYWTTSSITTSVRLYKESFTLGGNEWDRLPNTVPTGAAAFPYDLIVCPESWYRFSHPNLLHYTEMKTGGHFAALEQPMSLFNDIVSFVNKAENWRKQNKDGNRKGEL